MQSVITPQVVHGVPKPPLGFSQAAGLLFSVLLVSHVHVPQHSKDILATRYPISATAALKRDLARLRKLDRERAALVVDPHDLVAVREQRPGKSILVSVHEDVFRRGRPVSTGIDTGHVHLPKLP